MTWRNPGPYPSDQVVREFEARTAKQIPPPVLWFLRNVVNGGRPNVEVTLPISGLEGEPCFDLHGLYGVGHPTGYYDLDRPLDDYSEPRLRQGFPVGYDGLDGQIVYVLEGRAAGEVHYVPYDEFAHPAYSKTYPVAKSMEDFARLIEEGASNPAEME